MRWLDLISVGSAFFTVLALVLSWVQLIGARRQAQEIQQVRLSMSTRYIGTFPEYFRNIVDLVKDAKKEIVICCNFPTSAFFSAHAEWREYRNALEERSHAGIRLEVILPDRARRERLNEEDFAFNDKEWNQWKSNPAFRNGIEELIAATAKQLTVTNLDKRTMLELVETNDSDVLRTTFRRADITETSFVSPLHFWIIDGVIDRRRAIFTVPFTTTLASPPVLGNKRVWIRYF